MTHFPKQLKTDLAAFAVSDYGKDPRLKGVRQFQTQPQKRGQTADNWGGKKYEHLPLFDVRAPPPAHSTDSFCPSSRR